MTDPMISTPRKAAQQERVSIREREDVIRGAKAHGAGAASPKERQARPGADVLTSFEVEDDDRDPNWDGESTSASPRGARSLRLLPVPEPQSRDALPMPQSSDSLPMPQSSDSLHMSQSSDALHKRVDVDALSELTWPTPSPPPPEMRNAAVGGQSSSSGGGVFGAGSGGGAFDAGVGGGAFDAGSPGLGVGRQQSAALPVAGRADIAPAPSGDRCVAHKQHCSCGRCLREDNVSRPRWRTIVVPLSPPDDQQLHRHGGVEEERSGPGAEGQPASSSILAPPFVVPQIQAELDDYPTRILRALFLLLLALVSIVVTIHLFSFLSRLYIWSSAHAQATAQKLDVLYSVADNVTVVLGLALYVPILLAQLGIAQFPNILSASAVLGVYVLWKKWGSGVYVLWKKWMTAQQ